MPDMTPADDARPVSTPTPDATQHPKGARENTEGATTAALLAEWATEAAFEKRCEPFTAGAILFDIGDRLAAALRAEQERCLALQRKSDYDDAAYRRTKDLALSWLEGTDRERAARDETVWTLIGALIRSRDLQIEALRAEQEKAKELDRSNAAVVRQHGELQDEIVRLRERLADAEAFTQKYLTAIAQAIGIDSPLILIAHAESNEENYADILLKLVAASGERLATFEALALTLARKLVISEAGHGDRPDPRLVGVEAVTIEELAETEARPFSHPDVHWNDHLIDEAARKLIAALASDDDGR